MIDWKIQMPPKIPVLVIEYWNLWFNWNLVLEIWNLKGKLRSQRKELFASGLPDLGLFFNRKPKCVCPALLYHQSCIASGFVIWAIHDKKEPPRPIYRIDSIHNRTTGLQPNHCNHPCKPRNSIARSSETIFEPIPCTSAPAVWSKGYGQGRGTDCRCH